MMSAKSPIIKTQSVTVSPLSQVIPNYGYSSGHDINLWLPHQRFFLETLVFA
ncbi:hypothetical protein ACE1CM_38685 [Microseira sp. BLCC-F43]